MPTSHPNIFNYGDDKAAVYEALQRDYKRDQRVISWLDGGFVAFIFALSYFKLDMGPLIWLIVLGLVGSRMCYFIDNSNRNWTMHLMDWIESTERGRQ